MNKYSRKLFRSRPVAGGTSQVKSMVFPLENIARQKKNLIQKHPNLNSVQLVPLEKTGLSLDEISAFIEQCWRKDYTDEARITFCPNFLEYNINGGPSLVLWGENKEINGVFLGYNVGVEKEGEFLQGCLCTGLSTHPDCTGQGIAQMLYLSQLELIIKKEFDFSLYWFDSNHVNPGNAYHIFGQNRENVELQSRVKIYGKSFDIKAAEEAVCGLNIFEKLGITIINLFFTPQDAVFKNYEFNIYQKGDHQEYDFSIHEKENIVKRVFSETELDFKSCYNSKEIKSRSFFLHNSQGKLAALMRGYTNPTCQGPKYFQVDYLFLGNWLSWSEKKKFISHCEKLIYRTERCFGIVVPANVCTDNLFRFGYIPLDEQVLALNCFSEKARGLTPDRLDVEVR